MPLKYTIFGSQLVAAICLAIASASGLYLLVGITMVFLFNAFMGLSLVTSPLAKAWGWDAALPLVLSWGLWGSLCYGSYLLVAALA